MTNGTEAQKQVQKPLTEKEKAQIRAQRNEYKKTLKSDVELLELEIKWLQYTLMKPELEMKLFKLQEEQKKAQLEHLKETQKSKEKPKKSKEDNPKKEVKEEGKVIQMKS